MPELLVQVTSARFCAGIVLMDDIVTEAAPILRRHVLGKTRDQARAVFAAKGWEARVVRSSQ